MSEYLKKCEKDVEATDDETRSVVLDMLSKIKSGGESEVLRYSRELDNYTGDVIVPRDRIEAASLEVSDQVKDDIKFAYDRVRKFAEAQRDSISEVEVELSPGVWASQKILPVEVAGCYVPAGRYAHVASVIMSIGTAKVAGVETVIGCSSPKADGVNPAILYAMDLCGADYILALGGVQGIASMTYGLFTGKRADILIGPGNRFVAESKRVLFGGVGIDMIAGPTEIGIIADSSADARIVAQDLVSQAEHGYDSPAWLFSTSRELAEEVMKIVPDLISALPADTREVVERSWSDYGEIIFCESREEAVRVSDEYAAEHLELQTSDNDWYVSNLGSYGSLFVGEETTVTYGDKCSGTNHILPTRGAARYTGGLSVHKFMKVVTTQRMTREANREVGAVAARISRLEGMEAHARSADVRMKKYFGDDG